MENLRKSFAKAGLSQAGILFYDITLAQVGEGFARYRRAQETTGRARGPCWGLRRAIIFAPALAYRWLGLSCRCAAE